MTRDRLRGVDAARGLALAGMVATHILPLTRGGEETITGLVADGRSSALFAVLAGVGIALSTRGVADARSHAAAGAGVVVRGLLVGLLGLVLAGLDPPVAIILAYYGLLFVVAVPLLRAPAWLLGSLAVVAAVGTPVVSHLLRAGLPAVFPDGPSEQLTPASLADPATLVTTLTVTGYYPVLTWTTYLLAGLAVGRLDLRRPRVAVLLLAGGGVLAVATAVVSGVLTRVAAGAGAFGAGELAERQYGSPVPESWWWLVVDLPHSGTPFDLAHTTGTALAVLGAMLLLAQRLPALVRVPAAVGSVPLTLYALHVLAVHLLGGETPAVYVVHLAAAVLVGAVAVLTGRRGPLEGAVAAVAGRVRAAVAGGVPPVAEPVPRNGDHRIG